MVDENLLEFPPEKDENVVLESIKDKVKLQVTQNLEDLVVEVNGVPYNGDLKAQSNMGDAGTIANWMFNKAIVDTFLAQSQNPDVPDETKAMFGAIGSVLHQVYQAVYIDNVVHWKGADNELHQVQGESVLKALHQTMVAKGEIIASSVEVDNFNDEDEE